MNLFHKNKFDNIDFNKYSSVDLNGVLEILILHKKNIDVTSIVFELCCREFKLISIDDIYTDFENTSLNKYSNYIKQLKLLSSFNRDLFCSLYNETLSKEQISIKVLWWLDRNNIFSIEEYWAKNTIPHIIFELKSLIVKYNDNLCEQNRTKCIAKDFFIKLFLVHYSEYSSAWFNRMRNILQQFLNDVLEEVFINVNEAKLLGFISLFSTSVGFYGPVLKGVYKNIIQKLLCYQENINIFNVLKVQEQWTTKHLTSNILDIFYDLLKIFTLEEIFEFANELAEDKINLRYFLTLLGVYVRKNSNAFKLVKTLTQKNVQIIFNDKPGSLLFHNNITEQIQVLLTMAVIRQCCLEHEQPEQVYGEWFSNAFGANSVLRTGEATAPWVLLLTSLYEALPHEPAWVLKVHSSKALRAPAMCNKDALAYKDKCKLKLAAGDNDSQDV